MNSNRLATAPWVSTGIVAVLVVALGSFLVTNGNWAFFLELFVLAALLPLLAANVEYGLLALLVARPMVDAFGAYVFVLLDRFSLNFASLLSVVAVIWCVAVLLRQRQRLRPPLMVSVLLFFFLAALGLLFTPSFSVTATELVRLASVFLLYAVAGTVVTTAVSFRRLLIAVVLSLGLPCALAIVQFIRHAGLSFGEAGNRLYGTFGHPNVFAFYLVLALSLLLGWLFMQQRQRFGWRWVGIMILSGLLLFTYTRSAWLGFALVLVLFGFFRFRRLLISVALISILLVLLAPAINRLSVNYLNVDISRTPVMQRVLDKQSDDSSVEFRLRLWSEMRRKVIERPLLGHGLGTFPLVRERQIFGFFQGTEAHNDYLRLAVETGVLGLTAYVVLLLLLFRSLIRVLHQTWNTAYRYPVLGLAGFLFAFFFMSFFDNLLQATAVMWLLWVVVAAVLNIPKFAAAADSAAQK